MICTNTIYIYQKDIQFVIKDNWAQLFQVLGINKREEWQELKLLKYAYSP